MIEPRSILITGASSGIGRALAMEYAEPGVHLALVGRHGDRLQAVADLCRDRQAAVTIGRVSVTSKQKLHDWILAVDDAHPLDLVIANAGISGIATGDFDTHIRRIFDVNVTGTFNTLHPAIQKMRVRKHGHIAIMSSLAALRPGLGEAGYGASKAMLKFYGQALRYRLMHDNIGVSVICPGYVQTPMTARNECSMPFLISAEKAAATIRRGVARSRPLIAFPWPAHLIARLVACIPEAIAGQIFRPSQGGAGVLPLLPTESVNQASS